MREEKQVHGDDHTHEPLQLERIALREIYRQSAHLWSLRATCTRARVGAVLVRDGRIIASGFNGSPSGSPHCIDSNGCLLQERDGRASCIRTLHCEQAIISFCARNGISTAGTEMWITLSPCYDCAKLIINAGITRVFYGDAYGGCSGVELLRACGVDAQPWE